MRNKAKKIAEDTLEAVKSLHYKTSSGKSVSIETLVKLSVSRSMLYKPDWKIYLGEKKKNLKPEITVTTESTLEAASRLADANPCVLNFASAKHPGGGFLQGALAQEESIARSTALYHTLIQHPEFYEENKRSQRNDIGLYLDYAIYSPGVPVIRNDRGDWLDEPYTMSVVTSPAPNRSAILGNISAEHGEIEHEPSDEEMLELELNIAEVLYKRMHQILSIMAGNNHRTIILGAWGCGVFGNVPAGVANLFKETLENLPFFDKVVFAIYSPKDSEVVQAFEKVFV
jgi:uncharacterized protein (TIGR02452 family)